MSGLERENVGKKSQEITKTGRFAVSNPQSHPVAQDFSSAFPQNPQPVGHYAPARERIVISRTLEHQDVPRYVVEFVMDHELLHKQLGGKWGRSRVMFHTPEFRGEERKFKRYEQAQRWLGKLASRVSQVLQPQG